MSLTDPDYDVPCDMACQLAKEGAAPQSLYRFPATRWVHSHQILDQTRKVIDEANEAFHEARRGAVAEGIADELLDVIQAAETGLRMLEFCADLDVEAARARVEAKNRSRGYYDPMAGGDLVKGMPIIPICKSCLKRPYQLPEYDEAAHEEGITADESVKDNEGTYNADNGHFYCTDCYIKVGMPLGVAP